MKITELDLSKAEEYLELTKIIDAESDYLLFEEGERKTTLEEQKNIIQTYLNEDNSIILVAEIDGQLVGYLTAKGGQAKRNKHSIYIAIGIRKDFTGQGIGTKLFKSLENWAVEQNVTRMELGVIDKNIPAFLLYKKMGFELEGMKRNAFRIDGEYVNEYMMAKFL